MKEDLLESARFMGIAWAEKLMDDENSYVMSCNGIS